MADARRHDAIDGIMPLNMEAFVIKLPPRNAEPRPAPKPAKRTTGRFLKGPVPLSWLVRAGGLPGKTLLVGLGLWYRAGLTKSYTVKASGALWREFALTRHAAYRGVRALETAGLASVVKQPGKAMVITLIVPGREATGSG